MYKTVLFDFDGTVYDTVEGITKSVRYAMNKHGMDKPLEELRCFAGPPLLDMFMSVCGVDEAQAEQMVADYRERYRPIGLHECQLFPGIKEILIRLKEQGIKTGITTIKPQEMAEMLLEREGMLDLFDVIYGSTGPKSSTKDALVQKAMETLGSEEESTVLVGDTKYDILGAHARGIRAIGVRYGYAAENELETAGADYIAEDMAELEKLLLG